MINGLHISNTYGIYVKNSNINKIANSKFENNGKGYSSLSQVSIKGGSMLFINSNFTIDSSLFYKNTANYGAGIYITCQFNPMCVTSISNTTFSNNYAQNSGGGFIYDLYRPTLSNIVFISNSALYGPNIASYPIKIKIGDTSINTVTVNDAVSGQITQAFTFNILDFDDQVITLGLCFKNYCEAKHGRSTNRRKKYWSCKCWSCLYGQSYFYFNARLNKCCILSNSKHN